MAEGGQPKGFKVTYGTRKVLVYYKTYAEFLKKCKDKFKLEDKRHVAYTLLEDDTEVDEDCFADLPDKSDIQLHMSEQIGVQTLASGSENVETDTENQSGNGDSRNDDYYNCYDTGSEEDIGDVSWFKWDDEEAIKEHISKYGQNGLESLLKDSLEGWRRQQVNIAIIGQSGKGKSSLINAVRNITEVDSMAAEVGENETTLECRPYPHPENENIVYWDVPGCGTKYFPSESYIEKIQIDRYDIFLLVSSERFHELDIWLAGELKKRGKRHCFVRTKIDVDMMNAQRRQMLVKRNATEADLLRKLKVEVKTGILTSLGTTDDINLFLVSNHHLQQYDFPALLLNIVDEANIHKRLSLTYGITGLSTAVLKKKVKALRRRFFKLAIYSAVSFMHPTSPEFLMLLRDELVFYRRQMSLDEHSLEKLANMAGMDLKSLENSVQMKSIKSVSEKDIGLLVAKVQKQTDFQEHMLYHVPVTGANTHCKLMFYTITGILNSELTLMEKDAKEVLKTVMSKKAQTYM